MRNNIFLGLGSNLGDREGYLRSALHEINKIAEIETVSSIWESPPWGKRDQPAFLNLVIRAHTALSPLAFLQEIKAIETKLGRLPREKWGPREIDIDILFWNDLVLNSPALTIPHPHWHDRAFVVLPLAEIAPDFRPPASLKTVGECAAGFARSSLPNAIKIRAISQK